MNFYYYYFVYYFGIDFYLKKMYRFNCMVENEV